MQHSEVQRSPFAERLSQLAEGIIYPFACFVFQLAICWHALFSGKALSLDRVTGTCSTSSCLGHLEDLGWMTPCRGVKLVLPLWAAVITLCSHIHTAIKEPVLVRRNDHVSPCKSETGGSFKASFICKIGWPGHTDLHSNGFLSSILTEASSTRTFIPMPVYSTVHPPFSPSVYTSTGLFLHCLHSPTRY